MRRHLRDVTAAGECRSIFNGINRWWRVWIPRHKHPESEYRSRPKAQRIASEGAAHPLERNTIAGQNHRTFELLLMRMQALQLEVSEVVRLKPAMFQHLTRVCTNCGCKIECEHDIARELAGKVTQGWENYCPNAATLHAIGALAWFGIMGAAGR